MQSTFALQGQLKRHKISHDILNCWPFQALYCMRLLTPSSTLPIPEHRNFRDFFSDSGSGECVGLLPGNKNETIEFFLEPGLTGWIVRVRSSSFFPIHSLLLAGVIFSLQMKSTESIHIPIILHYLSYFPQ